MIWSYSLVFLDYGSGSVSCGNGSCLISCGLGSCKWSGLWSGLWSVGWEVTGVCLAAGFETGFWAKVFFISNFGLVYFLYLANT